MKAIINNRPETGIIKKINNQKSKKLTNYKNKIKSVFNNKDKEYTISSSNKNEGKKIRFISDINLDIYADELTNKNKDKNESKTNINNTKIKENSDRKNKTKNIIHINKIDINKNINNFNNYTYTTIVNNKNPILNASSKNKINQLLKNFRNNNSNLVNFKDYDFSPASYKPLFPNQSPNPDINSSGLKKILNQFKTIKIENGVNNQIKSKTLRNPKKLIPIKKYLKKNITYHRQKIIIQKFPTNIF